jgi:regulator of sigma E protease
MASLISFIVALAILIAVHEFGHFWVARKSGVKVLKFSIGFGKPIWKKTASDGTEYVLAAIPLGGYVKMLDEREGQVEEYELDKAFNRQPLRSRVAIVAAGPIANILFAILAYWLIFIIGISGMRSVIGEVEPESPAALAQLLEGDEIKQIDGDMTPTWSSVNNRLTSIAMTGGKAHLIVNSGGIETLRELDVPKSNLKEAEIKPVLQTVGIRPVMIDLQPVIGQVIDGQAADNAGLKIGDKLIAADGVNITNWLDWVELIRTNPGKEMVIEVERGSRQIELKMTPIANEQGIGLIGAGVDSSQTVIPDTMKAELKYGPIAAIAQSVKTTWQFTSLTVTSLIGMISGEVSSKNIGGPITIAQFAGASAERGLISFLSFLAVISISLGILNLLPIPILDGGHLMMYFIEWIKGGPLSEQSQIIGQKIGLLLLLGLMFLAFFNDLSRLFG